MKMNATLPVVLERVDRHERKTWYLSDMVGGRAIFTLHFENAMRFPTHKAAYEYVGNKWETDIRIANSRAVIK